MIIMIIVISSSSNWSGGHFSIRAGVEHPAHCILILLYSICLFSRCMQTLTCPARRCTLRRHYLEKMVSDLDFLAEHPQVAAHRLRVPLRGNPFLVEAPTVAAAGDGGGGVGRDPWLDPFGPDDPWSLGLDDGLRARVAAAEAMVRAEVMNGICHAHHRKIPLAALNSQRGASGRVVARV